MKKILIIFVFAIFFSSLVSSEIIINQQPKEIYNFGDVISIPVTIKSLKDTSGVFQMNIICEGQEENFYRNGVGLSAGEEKRMDSTLVLTRAVIRELKGDCRIKAALNSDYVLTSDFRISDVMMIQKTSEAIEFKPGEGLFVKGSAVKESGEGANGFVEMQVIVDGEPILTQIDTIRLGFFTINATIPMGMRAGAYLIRLNAYEKDSEGFITNKGSLDFNVAIQQIPSNLEIIFENSEVNPGENLRAKIVLHDQTGEGISAISYVTITDQDGNIIEQINAQTDSFFEFPIVYNTPPSVWMLSAESRNLKTNLDFTIKEKQDVKVELVNRTLLVTNIGNVPYNNSVRVKIEDESLYVRVYLDVNETKKYLITAPNGEYNVEVSTNEGNVITGMALLSGRTTSVRESTETAGVGRFIQKPVAWGFLILVLGLMFFFVSKKVQKKNSFGFEPKKSSGKKEKAEVAYKKSSSLIGTLNKAELSLSIKGNKQDASVVCLKIKNFDSVKSKKEGVEGVLTRISNISNENKAFVYENQDVVFFILAPEKTKTFRNEETALKIAQSVAEALNSHNRLFKSKIDFGICIHQGTIIMSKHDKALKFVGLGNFMANAKKIASLSDGDVLLSENINGKIQRNAKTQKETIDGTDVFRIKEMKIESEANKKFISNFLRRIEEK